MEEIDLFKINDDDDIFSLFFTLNAMGHLNTTYNFSKFVSYL